MAELEMKEIFGEYPTPDWTMAVLGRHCPDEVEEIGWAEGRLPEERPYYAEVWRSKTDDIATIYFSTHDLEEESDEALINLLVDAEVVRVIDKLPIIAASDVVIDANGNTLWSINVILQEEAGRHAIFIPTLQSYPEIESAS